MDPLIKIKLNFKRRRANQTSLSATTQTEWIQLVFPSPPLPRLHTGLLLNLEDGDRWSRLFQWNHGLKKWRGCTGNLGGRVAGKKHKLPHHKLHRNADTTAACKIFAVSFSVMPDTKDNYKKVSVSLEIFWQNNGAPSLGVHQCHDWTEHLSTRALTLLFPLFAGKVRRLSWTWRKPTFIDSLQSSAVCFTWNRKEIQS